MTYERWADQSFADGRHRVDEFPVHILHPIRHGRFAVELAVESGVITACAFDILGNHRGDEKLLEVRDLRQGLALIDRHGWLTAPFAETLYATIVEDMLGMSPPPRAFALRQLALELNRAAVDALWRYLDADLEGAPSSGLDERDALLAELEALTGARIHAGYARIGGVGHDISAEQLSRLALHTDPAVAAATAAVSEASGAIALPLPKTLRLPEADRYAEIDTPHGVLGMWIVGRGDKVPYRVHLRTPGFTSLAALEHEAIGMSTATFLRRLARVRFVPGEVCR